MDNLSAESKSLYEILKAESKEEYEARFLAHKKEILDAMRDYVTDTTKQIQEINTAVDSVRVGMGKELTEAREALGTELEAVKAQISADIAHLATAVDRVARPSPDTAAGGSGGNGPDGHGSDSSTPGKGCATHTSPPGGGMDPDSKTSSQFFPSRSRSPDADASASAPRVELPHFEGTNPKLWQRRSEEYFQRWNTPRILWVSYSTSQFTGAAATWLESFLERNPCADWKELVDGVMARFMRNQQQVLLRRFYHISQTSTVADYVQRFSDLVDQLQAHGTKSDPLHYLTKFLDGLRPAVRVLIAIQQPQDLDAAYTMALLYEELGDGCDPLHSHSSSGGYSRRLQSQPQPAPPPPPPAKWISKTVEEKRGAESSKSGAAAKWQSLKAYRRAKNLCFTCGEKYSREHRCSNTISLHVVQEMVEFLQDSDSDHDEALEHEEVVPANSMMLSIAATHTSVAAPKTMRIPVVVQGKELLFLIDSGSSTCFIDSHVTAEMTGVQKAPISLKVKVAGGELLDCSEQVTDMTWSTHGCEFVDSFRVLDLRSYDGIVGLDWLAKHSPMITHWEEQWIAIVHAGTWTVLYGEGDNQQTNAVVELQFVHDNIQPEQELFNEDIQILLDQFEKVFAEPTGLPPRRQYDHQIPLIPGARPVSIRPYRVVPELKTEIEKQVGELLKQGIITHSTSPFASPVLLVRKDGNAWRLVVDFRRLNALTMKGKYPLPVIDEL